MMNTQEQKKELNLNFINQLNQAATGAALLTMDDLSPHQTTVSQRRRSRRGGTDEAVKIVTLTETDGVLIWEDGLTGRPSQRRGRRGPGPRPAAGEVLTQFKFETLKPNEIGKYLEALDHTLSPQRGLRRFDKKDGQLKPVSQPAATGRVLVIIHGTFSNCDNLFDELKATVPGKALLRRAAAHYDEVLVFDHATVSVSPVLNALDLGRLFAGSKAAVDVISHSRGGLVTRWWLEAFDQPRQRRRAVLVGSPLRGTSLAAPDKLRNGLNLLTNVGRVLTAAGDLVTPVAPFLTVVTGLLRVVSSVTGVVSNTPLIDAAIAMIPGLSAQSMTSNNAELLRLNDRSGAPPDYFAVRSNFEPSAVGWEFWKAFVNIKGRAANAAADLLVFEKENDLVVDLASMNGISKAVDLEAVRIYEFGTNDRVHHTNYFRQPETLKFIADSLQIP